MGSKYSCFELVLLVVVDFGCDIVGGIWSVRTFISYDINIVMAGAAEH